MQNYQKIFMLLALTLPARESLAGGVAIPNDKYKSVIEISATHYRKRPISEMDLMIPMWQNNNNLSIFDIKLKKDRKSFEYNLGLVYRHNFDDRWIFGIYSYFDRRRTEHKLEANQWTFGTEALSRFFDARFNFYLPENKKQTIYTKPRELKRDHTAIYAVSDGKFQERTLLGYDIEVGAPLFGLIPKMDDKFGTKIYVAKYDFARKGVTKNSGIRLRLEQKLFAERLEDSLFSLTLHLGTHYTNKKKWDNFVGLSLRVPLSADRPRRTKMQERMMDTVIRDVDIRTERHMSQPIESLYFNDKKIQHVYFVAEKPTRGGGDGSSENPYSIEDLQKKLKSKDTNFIIVPIGRFTEEGYNVVMSHDAAIDHITNDVVLATSDRTSSFCINDHFPELVVEKSPDNHQVDSHSAVTSIQATEQAVPEKREQESQRQFYGYSQDNTGSTYANVYVEAARELAETEKTRLQDEQRVRENTPRQRLADDELTRQAAEQAQRDNQIALEAAHRARIQAERDAAAKLALLKAQQPPLSDKTQQFKDASSAWKGDNNTKDFKKSGAHDTGSAPALATPRGAVAQDLDAKYKAAKKARVEAVRTFIPKGTSGTNENFVPIEPKSARAIMLHNSLKAGQRAATAQGFQPINQPRGLSNSRLINRP